MDNPSALVVPSEITRISPFPSGVTLLPSQLGASTPAPAELTNTYSVELDGVNDYINVPDDSALSFAGDGPFSGVIWAKMVDATTFRMLVKADASSKEYLFTTTGADNLGLLLYTDNSNYLFAQTTSSVTSYEGAWTCFGFSYDGSETYGGITLYVNGVAQSTSDSSTGTYTGMSNTTVPFTAGYFPVSYADGKIDEYALFGSELSAAQHLAIYNSGVPVDLTSYSPVLWHRCGDNDGGTGTTITDQGSSGSNGTLVNGPTFSTDRPATSLPELTNTYSVDFDGTNDYMAADGVATDYASDTTGSMSAWINMDDATPAAAEYIFSISDASASTFAALYVNPEGRLTFAIQSAGTNQVIVRTDPTAFSDNTWHHVAVVQDGVLPVVYIDGSAPTQSTLVSTDTTAYLGDLTGLDVSTVGALRYQSSTTLYFAGLIDEVSYFSNVALTSDQVSNIYNGGTPDDLTSYSPVGWWRMGDNDGGSGTTITDQGAGANNGTLTNGPAFSNNAPVAQGSEIDNTYSVDFDGSNDFMAADGAASAASGFNGGTWMMWVAPDDASPSTSQTIISFGDDNADSFIQISIGGISQTIITASCTSGGTQQWVINTSDLSWTATDWHHVAIVHNGTDATIYIDGVASGSYTVTTDKTTWHNDIAGLDKFTVGAKVSNSSTGQYFDGKVDEVAVCETQLTAANLLEIASATTAKVVNLSTYSPVGWWRMGDNDGGTGTTVTDQGSGSNNGTLTNGPTFSTTVQ